VLFVRLKKAESALTVDEMAELEREEKTVNREEIHDATAAVTLEA